MYRDEKQWPKYRDEIQQVLASTQSADGSWQDSNVGNVYVTAINATILQLEKGFLPIYQR